ncbi:hypothetical protein BB561_000417 [Smittium simulii]|uniref:Large ribosomal subunit protein uL14m n=1 Tax=Smittium simulii TaxID=133385 RepID=A0A2T9YZ95_9FUNG|nr:hypothetical protein BB561_000417 [Smittium simulii]
MIQMKTRLHVIDNSGAIVVECIKVLRNAKWASIGDEIVVAVKVAKPLSNALSATNTNKAKKGDVHRALIVRTKKEIPRADGRYIRFDDNACILLNNQKQPLGSRILGIVARELKEKKWVKAISLAPKVI